MGLPWSGHTGITKSYKLGDLNNGHVFLTDLESGKSKIKVSAKATLGEGPLPGMSAHLVSGCSNALPGCVLRRTASGLFFFL